MDEYCVLRHCGDGVWADAGCRRRERGLSRSSSASTGGTCRKRSRRSTGSCMERMRLVHDARRVKPLIKQLNDYLSGKRTSFDLEYDISWMTPFRKRVMEECAKIPRGQTATYAELARRAGNPTAYRAVGSTMATNPVPIVVPCHRVLGSNGDVAWLRRWPGHEGAAARARGCCAAGLVRPRVDCHNGA